MKSLFLIPIFLFFQNIILCQKVSNDIDKRFKHGAQGLAFFVHENIKYPKNLVPTGFIGNSISRIVISPKGRIDSIRIINPIDSTIDSLILKVLFDSNRFWKEIDSSSINGVFYIQIAFVTKENAPNIYYPKSKDLSELFVEPIIIKPIDPLSVSSERSDITKISFITNEEIAQQLNALIDSAKYEKALPFVTDLIKRDPFNLELYNVRIMINIRIGNKTAALADGDKIFDFAGGFSLKDILKDMFQK